MTKRKKYNLLKYWAIYVGIILGIFLGNRLATSCKLIGLRPYFDNEITNICVLTYAQSIVFGFMAGLIIYFLFRKTKKK